MGCGANAPSQIIALRIALSGAAKLFGCIRCDRREKYSYGSAVHQEIGIFGSQPFESGGERACSLALPLGVSEGSFSRELTKVAMS